MSLDNSFMIKRDTDGSIMLVGISDKDSLMNDNNFHWFNDGYERYEPNNASIRIINEHLPSLHILVFAGTWCGDTHTLLPEFYKAMDAAGVGDAQITLHLVDRDKKTQDGSSDNYSIANVPTFIIVKHNIELGRVVESVKTSIEAEIADILAD